MLFPLSSVPPGIISPRGDVPDDRTCIVIYQTMLSAAAISLFSPRRPGAFVIPPAAAAGGSDRHAQAVSACRSAPSFPVDHQRRTERQERRGGDRGNGQGGCKHRHWENLPHHRPLSTHGPPAIAKADTMAWLNIPQTPTLARPRVSPASPGCGIRAGPWRRRRGGTASRPGRRVTRGNRQRWSRTGRPASCRRR